MTLRVAHLVKALSSDDFRILRAIEKLRMKHEFAPIEFLPKMASLSPSYLSDRLKYLHKLDLLVRPAKRIAYEGIDLTFGAFDVLALKKLTDQDVLLGLGDQIGMGKESDVLLGTAEDDHLVAVKIHRLGKAEFRAIRRTRSYIAERRHLSSFYESKLAAEREFEALSRLYPRVRVPQPLAINRHMIVMELLDGDPLNKVRQLTPEAAGSIFDEILEMVEISVTEIGIIHGDFSEFNIILSRETLDPVFFDYPQFAYTHEPAAEDLLSRDIENICHFFAKRFNLMAPDIEKMQENLNAYLNVE
ncbi:MAG: RIO1 family regulatory kinase/ATPase domain-containing protein [Candidatus Hodarchaeales archaeon]|jgi:RIO kinase 2